MEITFRPVQASDAAFLYELLKSRPSSTNISHRELPSFEKHQAYIASRPYAVWEIVVCDGEDVGTMYLTDGRSGGQLLSEIGIFLLPGHHGRGIGSRALKLFMERHPRERFLANIAPTNPESQKFFERAGFRLVQYTYELRKGGPQLSG